MAKALANAARIINGTYGEVWIDGEKMAECSGCQLKVSKNKEKVNLCGQFMEDTKSTSGSGTGSLTLHKVDSGLLRKQAQMQDGIDQRFTIITKLRDPDSLGAERVAVYSVSFDDLTLADWSAASLGKVTAPFTFSRYEFLDLIEVQ